MEEKLIWEGSPSQVKNLGHFILGMIIMGAIIAGSLISGQLYLLVLIVIPDLYMLWKFIQLKSNHYEITNERIRLTTGIFSKQTEEIELYRIKDYKVVQPAFLRMFRLSNLHFTTSDRSTGELVIEAVKDGRELLDQIRIAVEERRDRKRVREVDYE